MILVSNTHDPGQLFVPLLKEIKHKLSPYLSNAVIAYTPATHPNTIEELKETGFTVVEGGTFNQGRIASLKKAMELDSNEQTFFSCCLDKLIHWVQFNKEEFEKIYNKGSQYDIELLGRTDEAWSTYPESWAKTESIVNNLFSKKLGFTVDALTGDLLISRRAALLVSKESIEPHAGACVEWPLIALREDFAVGCTFTNGLSWEDADRFKAIIKTEGGLEKWKEKYYEGLKEWKKRSQFQLDMINAIERLTDF